LGKVKSRLAKDIGALGALEVYKMLLTVTREVTLNLACDKVVFYSDFIDQEDIWPATHYNKEVQQGNDLGERIEHAFRKEFKKGYQHICIIGSDCAEITCELIEEAFSSLKSFDTVIGPAHDGGYYLLGMKEYYQSLFHNKSWSTDRLYHETLDAIKMENLSIHQLKTLTDVDQAKDLKSMVNFDSK